MDFGLKSVLTSLSLFRPQTQDDPDESMMAAKQGVSMMHDFICNECMHDARAMQQVASISQFTSKVQHTSFQPYFSHTRVQW